MRSPLRFQRPFQKSLAFLAAVLWLGAPLCEPVAANSLTHREIVELLGAADTSPDPSMEALTIFESLDADDDQLLTPEELAEALDYGELLVTTLYRRFDLGSDGNISTYLSFKRWRTKVVETWVASRNWRTRMTCLSKK